ncbi:M20 metallopeptidase family protein [Chitinophaga jiangningensis]|nr:M20 family metallopeptidase [Chitinophaga jiangningensis]
MKTSAILLLIFILFTSQVNKPSIHELISRQTDEIYDSLVQVRRYFHANPELAGKEAGTQQVIVQYLRKLGMEVDTSIYGHSVVGILHGSKPGRSIAWRADMDALPTEFADNNEFSSTIPGVQHACGHDVHMAIGLGIATILAKNKAVLPGTVYFIFQPEEETFKGAKNMIAHGLFSKIHPEELYGLHVTPFPAGQIMVKPGEMFAYQKGISIRLKNDVSEAAGSLLSKQIYEALSRRKPGARPWEIQHIIDTAAGLMNPGTMYKDYLIMDEHFRIFTDRTELVLESDLYETNKANLETIIPKITALINTTQFKDNLVSVSFTHGNPIVQNDTRLTNEAIKELNKIYGPGLMVPDYGQVPYFNDDFTYFQQKVPGVYFFLGGSNFQRKVIAMNHAPDFKVDESCIRVGIKTFSSLLVQRLIERN